MGSPVCWLQDLNSCQLSTPFHVLFQSPHTYITLSISLLTHNYLFIYFLKNFILKPGIWRYNFYTVTFMFLGAQSCKFWQLQLCSQHHSQETEQFPHSKNVLSCPLYRLSPSRSLLPGNCWSDLHRYSFAFSRTSFKWNHMACSFRCQASFIFIMHWRSIHVVVCREVAFRCVGGVGLVHSLVQGPWVQGHF